MKALGSRLVRL